METKTFYKDLGDSIRRRRKALGLTQADLASNVGLARPSVANIETGRQQLLIHQLYQFASALQMPVIDLLPAGNGEPTAGRPLEDLPLPEGLSAKQRAQISQLLNISQISSTRREGSEE